MTTVPFALLLAHLSAQASIGPSVWAPTDDGHLALHDAQWHIARSCACDGPNNPILFRRSELVVARDGGFDWIDATGVVTRLPSHGRPVGWAEKEPLLWDGVGLVGTRGAMPSVSLKQGDVPVFAVLFHTEGTIVTRTSRGTSRVSVLGSPPMSVDLGKFELYDARMTSASKGVLAFTGDGTMVVRVGRGRADIIATSTDARLGLCLGADGTSYVVRQVAQEGGSSIEFTDIDQLLADGSVRPFLRLPGEYELVDVDRTKQLVYVVHRGIPEPSYEALRYNKRSTALPIATKVARLVPAFAGPGYLSSG